VIPDILAKAYVELRITPERKLNDN